MNVVFNGQGTLQQQLCRALRDAITSGSLKANTKLSPSRVFAVEHDVSRNTVMAAYDQLCAEGYLETRTGAGTFVSAEIEYPSPDSKPNLRRINKPLKAMSVGADVAPKWSETVDRIESEIPEQILLRQPRQKLRYDFLYGEPSYTDLPLDRWARIVGRSARDLTEGQLGYGPVSGLPRLQEALAEYLGRARGVNCEPDQVFVLQGTQDAIDLTVRAFVNPGDTAVLEEPHYRGFARCLMAAGANIQAVEVDESGLNTAELAQIETAAMAFVTPSHQFPHGSVMSLARRQELLDWAIQNQTVIVEDDYDGEFRYESKPIPSLQSLDRSGLVIYVGTASKMLFPSLRLGWMVVPKQMVSTFTKLRALADLSGGILEQLAFTRFINEGHLDRHIHKVRRLHQERRRVLLDVLSKELGDTVKITGTKAGIHILLRLLKVPNSSADQIAAQAALQNVGVYPAQMYYSKAPKQAEFLLGYASLTPQQIRTGVKRLAKVIRSFTQL